MTNYIKENHFIIATRMKNEVESIIKPCFSNVDYRELPDKLADIKKHNILSNSDVDLLLSIVKLSNNFTDNNDYDCNDDYICNLSSYFKDRKPSIAECLKNHRVGDIKRNKDVIIDVKPNIKDKNSININAVDNFKSKNILCKNHKNTNNSYINKLSGVCVVITVLVMAIFLSIFIAVRYGDSIENTDAYDLRVKEEITHLGEKFK